MESTLNAPLPRSIIAMGCMAMMLASSACTRSADHIRMRDGIAYGVTERPFHRRWWHYYERGTSYAAGGFLAEAEADFRSCLQRRLTDARRARTYGMHFVQCFVHRELAAVLLAQGRVDEAREQLQISMRQQPSAKALHLLERIEAGETGPVDEEEALRVTVLSDIEAPAPAGEAPAPLAPHIQFQTSRSQDGRRRMTGTIAGDDDDGTRLAVLDQRGRTPLDPDADGRFAVDIDSPAALEITAAERTATLPIDVAPDALSLSFDGIEDGMIIHGETLWLQVEARAAQGLSHLTCIAGDGQERCRLPLSGEVFHGPWTIPLRTGEETLSLVLTDRAGHSSEHRYSVRTHASPPQPRDLRAVALLLPPTSPLESQKPAPIEHTLFQEYLIADGRFRYRDGRADRFLQHELALVEAGYVDRSTAARGGRRLQARYVLTSSLRRNRHEMECLLRLVHSGTGRVVAQADLFAPARTIAERRDCYQALAGMLRQIFPVLGGSIRSAEEAGSFVLDVGRSAGARLHMRFHRIRRTTITDDDGEPIATDQRSLATGDIYRLEAERAWLEPTDEDLDPGMVISE